MTTEQLNTYLANPGAINANDLEVIREYREKYPYSPVFAALYAKALHNLKDLKYDEALREAAIVLPDRSVLYHLIYREPLQEKIAEVQETVQEVEEAIEQPETVVEKVVVEQEEVIKEAQPDETQELEQDILIEAINTSIQLDVDQLLEEEISDDLEDWKEEETKEEEQPVVEEIAQPSKFSDWLFSMKDVNEAVDEATETPESLMSSKELIDRFIQSKKRKIDITAEPVTPQEMGKLSLVEDDVFVTETLAEIYAKQGKYQKAIKIYEQLSLNNPEKKVFFASRIRFLREKMEYDK
jgi:tetratricopeptide (TPR) repeat protein